MPYGVRTYQQAPTGGGLPPGAWPPGLVPPGIPIPPPVSPQPISPRLIHPIVPPYPPPGSETDDSDVIGINREVLIEQEKWKERQLLIVGENVAGAETPEGVGGVGGEPGLWPILGVVGAGGLMVVLRGLLGRMSLGMFKTLVARFGPAAVRLAIGGAIFGFFMDLIDGGLDDSTEVPFSLKKKPKRYTIGHNPRVKTLQKVARHTMKMIKTHDKYLREFLPKKKPTYGIPPAKALSAIEKAAIRG